MLWIRNKMNARTMASHGMTILTEKNTGDSVANHKNADQLCEDERNILAKVMSQFESLL